MLDRIYTSSARFDHQQRFLDEDEMRQIAPSIFATTAHESRSARFAPIATIDVVRKLGEEGFGVVGAKQSLTRKENGENFAKHMLRLRKKDELMRSVGDTVFEILLKNANDGTAKYDLLSGLFRIQCLNSVVAMANQMETHSVRHSGDVASKVIEGVYSVVKDADRALEAPAKWGRIMLDKPEQEAFAKAAHAVRFPVDKETGNQLTNVKPEQLLITRRVDDASNDLWTTFNVIQENALRGGLNNFGRNANGAFVRRHTREIKGIDQSTALNRALWTLGEEMAALKAA